MSGDELSRVEFEISETTAIAVDVALLDCDKELCAMVTERARAFVKTQYLSFEIVPKYKALAKTVEDVNGLLFNEGCRAITLTGKDYWAIPREIYDRLLWLLTVGVDTAPGDSGGGGELTSLRGR